MAELILNPKTLEALACADLFIAEQNGDEHTLTFYADQDRNLKSVLGIPGYVVGFQGYGDGNYTPGRSSASLYTPNIDVFKLLKVGDRLSLEWDPDAYTERMDELGMMIQTLTLRVERVVGTGKKQKTQRLKILLDSVIHDAANSYPMCRYFHIDDKIAERVARREERRRRYAEERAAKLEAETSGTLQIEHAQAAE